SYTGWTDLRTFTGSPAATRSYTSETTSLIGPMVSDLQLKSFLRIARASRRQLGIRGHCVCCFLASVSSSWIISRLGYPCRIHHSRNTAKLDRYRSRTTSGRVERRKKV